MEAVAFYCHKYFELKMQYNGAVVTKEQWKEGAASIFKNSNFKREASRCIYENDDILNSHTIMSFPNGYKDAIVWFDKKRIDA